MPPSDESASRFTRGLLWVLACGIALSPLSTKIAGAAWLLFSLWGLALWARRAPAAGLPAAGAVRFWLAACAVALVLAGAALWYWSDPFDQLNPELRLLIAAAALAGVAARGPRLPGVQRGALHAVAVSCLAALLCVAVTIAVSPNPRDALPANAIVWAVAVDFAVCLLLPAWLDETLPTVVSRAWLAALLLAGGAILLSQSRGALVVLPWALWLVAERWRRRHGHWPWARLAGLVAVVAVAGAALWMAPGDPLRMRQAEQEIAGAEHNGSYSTSMGTRIYLWRMAADGIASSPWIGIGGAERLRRIKHAGEELPEPQRSALWYVRLMGHVHNQYLHSALDGGVLGLAGVLALVVGMAGAAWRLRRIDPVAARQMAGLLFVHVAAGVGNVNFAHNYYVLALAAGVTIVLLGAGQRMQALPAATAP